MKRKKRRSGVVVVQYSSALRVGRDVLIKSENARKVRRTALKAVTSFGLVKWIASGCFGEGNRLVVYIQELREARGVNWLGKL